MEDRSTNVCVKARSQVRVFSVGATRPKVIVATVLVREHSVYVRIDDYRHGSCPTTCAATRSIAPHKARDHLTRSSREVQPEMNGTRDGSDSRLQRSAVCDTPRYCGVSEMALESEAECGTGM